MPRVRSAFALRASFAGALAACASAAFAAATQAAALPSTCTELTSKIATAAGHPNHGEGDVIVLNGMCDASNLKMSSGVSLPAGSNFSIEGAPGTTSGFDGAGVTAPLVHSAGFETVGTMTLRNLTFQHANVTASAGGALRLQIAHLTLAGDSFIENTAHGSLGGAVSVFVTGVGKSPTCPTSSAPAGVTVTSSTFRANKLVASGFASGGALVVAQICAFPGSVLEGDTFEGNTIEYSGSGEALGGALSFEVGGPELPTPVAQRANVFDSNRILASSTTTDYGGGGEWLEGASLTSVGDRFSRNQIPGTAGAQWSWGGGLGILNTNCNAVTPTESTFINGVVVGNAIGAGTPSDLGGAGLYVGCSPSPVHPNHLSLLDSTVTENSTPSGGVAGVDGNPGDQLRIATSIVAGDLGGEETGGFNGAGGSLTASFSDVCAAGGAAPLPGEGNICANPLLADNGNPSSSDVHETAPSPTIDAGSNALLPGGLGTDFFGGPRVLSARSAVPPCTPGGVVGPRPLAPVVDIGASEFGPVAVPAIAILCPSSSSPRVSSFAFPSISQGARGVLHLTFKTLLAGHVAVKATFKRTRTLFKKVKGHRRRVRKTETLKYGNASATLTAPGGLKLTLRPTAQALRLLARQKRLKVLLTITFVQPGLLAATQTKTITVRYKPPPKHGRRRH